MPERTSERPVGPGPRSVQRRGPTRMRERTECLRGEPKKSGPGRRCRPCRINDLRATRANRRRRDREAAGSSGVRPNTSCRVQARIARRTTDATTTDHVILNYRAVVPGRIQRPSGRSEVRDERYGASDVHESRPSGCSGVTALCITKSSSAASAASPLQRVVRRGGLSEASGKWGRGRL
jgi:hypothetical protein